MNTRLFSPICVLLYSFYSSQENEVTSSTDLVCTNKEEVPAPAASEVTAFVQSATSNEEAYSTTGTMRVSGSDEKPVDLSTKKSDSESSESTQGNVSGVLCFFVGR